MGGSFGGRLREYSARRFCRPISSTSPKPAVATRATAGNRSSTMALVTIVVPWTRTPTSSQASPRASSAARRLASGSPTRVRTLAVTAAPLVGSSAVASVKVPPMSMPSRQRVPVIRPSESDCVRCASSIFSVFQKLISINGYSAQFCRASSTMNRVRRRNSDPDLLPTRRVVALPFA